MQPQAEAVLKYLKRRGPLTPLEALSHLGVARLASRVYDLRAAGYPIRSDRMRVRARGGWATVAKYSLG